MKHFVIFLFLTLTFCSYSQNGMQQVIESERKAFLRNYPESTCAASGTYDVKYYCCRWNLDPSQTVINGNITMYFQALAAIDSIQLDASRSLTIDSVHYHNNPAAFLQLNNDILGIHFPAALPPGTVDSVTVYYQGSPPSTGFGSFENSSHGNNVPVIWTLSEPYGASDWWPCKNTLNDKADSIDVYITVPSGNKAVSNGLLKQVTPAGTSGTYHWKHRYPIATYLICAAASNYTEFTDTVTLQGGTLPVQYFPFPEDSIGARQTDTMLLTVLKFYDSLFIPYPFMQEKYGMAQFRWGGGMEHQTMTFIGTYAIDLLAHELAHHWFGDHITCGSWRDIWLNEGFAVYCTGLSMKRLFGPSAFRTWQEQQIGNITSAVDGSVFVDDTTNVSRVFSGRLTYAKGGYLLHMLRWKLGDSAFFTGVRSYEIDPSLSYSFARTAKLQQHLEASSGQNLTQFFNQWFYGQGYPSYLVIWKQDANGQMKISLNQSTSHSSVPFFEMPVPIRAKGNGHDTLLVLNHSYSGQTFYVNPGFKIDTVLFDPDLSLLSAQNRVIQEDAYLRSQLNLVIYPNPATNLLKIEVNGSASYPTRVELIDMLGQKVLDAPVNTNHFVIDVSDFSQGTYTLKLVSGGQFSAYKVIIGKQN